MKDEYNEAYSLLRYKDIDWLDDDIAYGKHEDRSIRQLYQMPLVAIGAAFLSKMATDYTTCFWRKSRFLDEYNKKNFKKANTWIGITPEQYERVKHLLEPTTETETTND